LEEGRKITCAEFIAILDADFLPTEDFLERIVPHFYSTNGDPVDDLAMVQAQWGHLNHMSSLLTLTQSLWLDDHHTIQMSFRSAFWKFVNFTGTAGIWRAAAIEVAGGWRADSLVEDCELSFRAFFAGYHTKFVKEVVQPAELPESYTAYKAQQKRWTQGWAQIIRLHWWSLLVHNCGVLKKFHLFYHMLIASQWLVWGIWVLMTPWLLSFGLLLPKGELVCFQSFSIYVAPTLAWAIVMTIIASLQTRRTYNREGHFSRVRGLLRMARLLPYLVIQAGMLPHQVCSFLHGFVVLGGEFEKTPKGGGKKGNLGKVKIHYYVFAEMVFLLIQVGWCCRFLLWWLDDQSASSLILALSTGYAVVAVVFVGFFYRDHVPGSHSYDCNSITVACSSSKPLLSSRTGYVAIPTQEN
jgi:cellulose synthase/poly-beta-1,6-N-acetylglucosamine synthase-like glycosyltransferase